MSFKRTATNACPAQETYLELHVIVELVTTLICLECVRDLMGGVCTENRLENLLRFLSRKQNQYRRVAVCRSSETEDS